MSPVLRLLAKRLVTSIIVLIGVSMLIFVIARVIPGDSGAHRAPGPNATAEQVQILQERLHLNEPIPVQYGHFISDVARGDLGRIALYQPPGHARHRAVPAGDARTDLRRRADDDP